MSELLERWRTSRLDREMMNFRDRSVARFSKVDGSPKAVDVQIEHRFVQTKIVDDDVPTTKETPVDEITGPPVPKLKLISPDNGKLEGNSYIEIAGETGSVFLNTAEVRFDGLLATDFHLYGPELLSVRTPAHVAAPQGVDVAVYNIPGNENTKAVKSAGFKYYGAPYITNVIVNENQAGSVIDIYGGRYYYPSNTQVLLNGQNAQGILMLDFNTSSRDFRHINCSLGGLHAATIQVEVVNPDAEHQRSGPYTYEHIIGYQISGPTNTDAFVFYQYTVRAIRSDSVASTAFSGTVKLVVYLAFTSSITGQNSIGNVNWTPVNILMINGVGHFSMRSNPYPPPSFGGSATSGDFYVTAVDVNFNPPSNYTGYGTIQIHVTQLS